MLLFLLRDSKAFSKINLTFMTYTLSPNRFLILRDQPTYQEPLEHLFRDSHSMFKLRVQHLGNKTIAITEEESETLRIMLEVLISAKRQLQRQ